MQNHYVADVTALGLEDQPLAYMATIEVSDHVKITATDQAPFWVMLELKKAFDNLGIKGTLEGIYDGETILDPIQGNGLRTGV